MDIREQNINLISRSLTYLKTEVSLRTSLNLTDICIHAENFYRDLLNLVYNLELKNSNYTQNNTAYIDLIDKSNKQAVQVTAQNDSAKINKSIKGFFDNSENQQFSLKILLIDKDAKEYTSDFSNEGKYKFDQTKDIIDIKGLIKHINNERTKKIKLVADFLKDEISLTRNKTESNEVETVMSLLKFLSDDQNYKELDEKYECDPDKKINGRFKDYASSFKEEFSDLFSTYCISINEAKNAFGLDGVRAKKISNFLKFISNRFLRESNDNPVNALDKLTDHFENKLSLNGIKADNGAIRYYLLDELIGCNIFSSEDEKVC
ncbi:MAG: SMEK domain-containing protein [bacterium]|nr:SMEK domain-containing protein [bacterium]